MDLKIDPAAIKSERRKRGWSQEQLAAAAGLGVRTIQRIEASGTASTESAKSLAAVFEVTLATLFAEERQPSPMRGRLWAAAGAASLALASSLVLMSRANATDVAMRVVVTTNVTGESRMNLSVNDGRQTEFKLEKDLWVRLKPTIQKDGNILLAAEVHAWDGSDFKLVGTPRLLLRQGAEAGLQLNLVEGRTAGIRVTAKEM